MSDAERVASYASVGAVVRALRVHNSKKSAIWCDLDVACREEQFDCSEWHLNVCNNSISD